MMMMIRKKQMQRLSEEKKEVDGICTAVDCGRLLFAIFSRLGGFDKTLAASTDELKALFDDNKRTRELTGREDYRTEARDQTQRRLGKGKLYFKDETEKTDASPLLLLWLAMILLDVLVLVAAPRLRLLKPCSEGRHRSSSTTSIWLVDLVLLVQCCLLENGWPQWPIIAPSTFLNKGIQCEDAPTERYPHILMAEYSEYLLWPGYICSLLLPLLS
ncbi:uncharacterized protein ARB_06927 [Trichophyton benhamiae CBS 112371]|uniref:Uncharacterized protein n=1 Tax=Arthroderma benhamiae (strain ATCC MYA-4681 / CBS 112371) TaxID=663331 RepID=D4ARR3_ARTBC|nr:uncharacterized protein ARB_06927 [Trichophyton benhamiae CBS 112371]EFE33977.1 hypothetical protein ARB_06927 [Trichophyton benhamiae CBS 112371]